jgi:gamma-glutamyltranspeptidase / glutathione hydrolase
MTHKTRFSFSQPPAPFLVVLLFSTLIMTGCASGVVVKRSLAADKGVVVCVDSYAARVGAAVLAQGGNAVDAAVAVGFALAVTYPQAGNLGGGGFMVIRCADGGTTCFDYREKAPGAAHPDMFLNEDGTINKEKRDLGFLCAGVPGTVAGLELAHRRFGSLPWRRLVDPAHALAAEGFTVDADLAAALRKHAKKLTTFAGTAETFFDSEGNAPEEGDRLVQPRLAATLALIREAGSAGFYRGKTAEAMIDAVREGGGIMTIDDLAGYEAKERTPVTGSYRGFTIVGMPLPSSGGTALIEMLNVLSGFDLSAMERAERLHIMAETMRHVFRDRAMHMGDADFITAPVDFLLSRERADQIRSALDRRRAVESRSLAGNVTIRKAPRNETGGKNAKEKAKSVGSRQTTHFSIIDAAGNMVSNTYTLEQTFGCKAVAGKTGVLLNNEMHDFNVRPGWTADDGSIGTPPNLIAPQKRMLSSMCPVVVLRDGNPFAVVGSPGGRTIINTVLQVIVNLIDLGLPPEEAVAAPRIHHQWFPDRIYVEKKMPDATAALLKERGHAIKRTSYQGDCHLIAVDPETGAMKGVADRRIDGFAAGPE